MKFNKYNKNKYILLTLCTEIFLNGCNDMVLMHPKGDIGITQRSLILTALSLMLIVVIPAIIMAFTFSIKYRASNNKHTQYKLTWFDSKKIEFIIWAIPICIIICLANLTWTSTHTLDPKKAIKTEIPPINIQVVALDWKWLFIYPEFNIATINEIVIPVNRPIKFEITSNSVMNSFFIPALGSQMYAMAGMNSILYLIANNEGVYKGISSNFSGYGFSGMKFSVIVTPNEINFIHWIQKVKTSLNKLDTMHDYNQLTIPSIFNKIEYFSSVSPNLYKNIIFKFMKHNHIKDTIYIK